MSDTLKIFGQTFTDVAGIKAMNASDVEETYKVGGADLSWIASATPTPSIRNLFAALANGTVEHGEFTLAATPTNAFVDLFTMQNFSEANPPQGVLFVDKDFYQGSDTLPHQSSEGISFLWLDKAFLNPAREQQMGDGINYGVLGWSIHQTVTSGFFGGTASTLAFDGTASVARGYYLFSNDKMTWKSQYGGLQYTTFIAGRTYIWAVY